jgi:hypothetical protein
MCQVTKKMYTFGVKKGRSEKKEVWGKFLRQEDPPGCIVGASAICCIRNEYSQLTRKGGKRKKRKTTDDRCLGLVHLGKHPSKDDSHSCPHIPASVFPITSLG